ncbi:MAG TPA: hypothetical protein VFQ40_02255 [Actinomycetota bacterium]|nr:hypothetical protein [Actinomycetota bacterium]
MADPIVSVDTSEIHEGKLDELRAAVSELAAFVESNEADPLSYLVYFSEDGRRMTVVQVHPDAGSMERHMEVAAPMFARFADLLTLRTVDVYGTPSEEVLSRLRGKAELLGTATVSVHDLQAGFARFAAQVPR